MARQRFDEIQLGLIAAIVAILEEPAGGLMQDGGRLLWRQFVDEAVDGLPQETYAVPHQEFLSVVRACARQEGALEELVRATELVAPAVGRQLQPLLEEWWAHRVYAGRSWSALRQALQPRLPELASLVSLSTDGRRALPAHCGTPWQAFVHLADLNSATRGLPPGMVLLEHLARCPELAAAVGEIRTWNDHFAREWGLLDGADGLRGLRRRLDAARRHEQAGSDPTGPTGPAGQAGESADQPGPDRTGADRPGGEDAAGQENHTAPDGRPLIRLYIRVAADRTPQPGTGRRRTSRIPRYHVSACVKYADSPTLHREPGAEPEAPVTREQLGSCIAELITRMAALWHNRSELVALEFFLPLELLNEPVEWWDRNPARGYANPLLSTYRVSVHSLDRVQRREFHRAWRARWTRWRENGGKQQHARRVVHECAPEPTLSDAEHLARLDAVVGSDDDVVGMLLCQPPWDHGKLGIQEVSLALDLGVPVLMYHREEHAASACRAAVREALAEDGLAALPQRAQQWRTDAAAGRPSAHDPKAIRSMGMIWDDPEHLLDGGPSAPATFVGGTD
ncbi:hypothetical protein [Streptomyces sp. NBC_00878]|uniref:VMAP-C domain-containing protein n=1 Tax=Streptomyces sp. NBC_00878 TaxID=2975854 RepID=UPI00225268D2|nr:hypothetical protein [Streptomyces sp. NBC_00878]MCX4908783.1 hypothetical protein [Streptomyces sp. NBC_00878]